MRGSSLAAAFLLAALGGCASAPPQAPFHLGAATLYLAPIADPDEYLAPVERALLRGEIAIALVGLTEKPRSPLKLALRESEADYVLHVEVDAFHEARPALAFVVGFGAGRPGYEGEARIERGGVVFARDHFERERAALMTAPGGTRRAMIDAIASEVERFVRRRR
jgi:hypothetical protein